LRALRGMPGLVLAVAVGTALAGWWAVPVVVAVWVWLSPSPGSPVWRAVIGAALAWGLLLGWTALHGPIGPLARRAGGLIWLPGWGLVLATVLFPATLAGLAALIFGRRSVTAPGR
jgi:hypothetical protein